MRIPLLIAVAALAAACSTEPSASPQPVAKAPAAAAPAAHEMRKIAPSASYPLKTCVVSGEDLGAMGDRVAYSCDGTEVQFCCPDCIAEFKKDPDKYLAKVRAAK